METFVIDIDGTLCESFAGCDYNLCKPIISVIEKTNKEYDDENFIILFTARGMRTFNGDVQKIEAFHRPILEKWLNKNNVKYHQLIFGKPWGKNVHYVDDKNLSIKEFLGE